MDLNTRIKAFVQLGKFLRQFIGEKKMDLTLDTINEKHAETFSLLLSRIHVQNGWFTEENIQKSVSGICLWLEENSMIDWISNYPELLNPKSNSPKKIGVILAGNIPLVGFHDMMCVLISGNYFVGRTSSSDKLLLPAITSVLIDIEPSLKPYIHFAEQLKNIDAVIATGSDNSARYFEFYFGKHPHIIRKNRNSIAILQGNESTQELFLLGKDIFSYFGLGCRNVSKIYIPADFDLNIFFEAIYPYADIVNHNKYANNYDYNKAVYLMGQNKLLDNNFILLKEDTNIASPVGILFYERYQSIDSLIKELEKKKDQIQCIVGKNLPLSHLVNFGDTQSPQINDYADGIDTMKFLTAL